MKNKSIDIIKKIHGISYHKKILSRIIKTSLSIFIIDILINIFLMPQNMFINVINNNDYFYPNTSNATIDLSMPAMTKSQKEYPTGDNESQVGRGIAGGNVYPTTAQADLIAIFSLLVSLASFIYNIILSHRKNKLEIMKLELEIKHLKNDETKNNDIKLE